MSKKPFVKARRTVKVPLHSIVHLITEIHKAGHGDEFLEHLKIQDASVTINPTTVNLVKEYLAESGLHAQSAAVMAAVHSTDPFDCPYAEM